jgi:hypothetical protein
VRPSYLPAYSGISRSCEMRPAREARRTRYARTAGRSISCDAPCRICVNRSETIRVRARVSLRRWPGGVSLADATAAFCSDTFCGGFYHDGGSSRTEMAYPGLSRSNPWRRDAAVSGLMTAGGGSLGVKKSPICPGRPSAGRYGRGFREVRAHRIMLGPLSPYHPAREAVRCEMNVGSNERA